MRAECLKAAAVALGRTLTKGEADEMEQRVITAMRRLAAKDPKAWSAMPLPERVMEGAKQAAVDIVAEKQLKQQRESLGILAQARIGKFISDAATRDMDGLDALDRTIAFHADGKANTLSIETQAKAVSRDALRQMITTLEASDPKWFGLFENQQGVRAIIQELFGEDSGSIEARHGAAEFHKVAEQLRQRFNRSGGDVGSLEDWGLPHHHSQPKVARAGRDAWMADVLPRLNRDAYINPDGTRMNETQLGEFLSHAWTTIATGGANKVEPGQFTGSGARANRGNESRQIHFKNSRSYIEYQAKYGDRSLYEVLVNHLVGVSKDIALVETYGPNPDQTFRLLRDTLVQKAKLADPTKIGKIDRRAIRLENLYNEVAGKRAPIASEWIAKSFDTLRSWLIAARLGSSVITSFSDDATLHLTGHVNNLPEMQLLRNELAALNPTNKMEERMALRAGLGLNTLISSLNRFGQDGLGASFSSKLANAVMRASGLNAMTEARKRAFGVTMMSSIGQISRDAKSLAALDMHDNRILLSKGITDADFAVWKAAQLEDWGGGNNTMLTPESIYRIPDAALKAVDRNALPQQLREQAAMRLLGAILEETDVAVVEPGARERSQMQSHLQRGTLKGELTRSFFLFKSFPMAMIERHVVRGWTLPTGTGRAAYLATLLAATTVLGAASLEVNEVVSGRDPRNLFGGKGTTRNWFAALLKGGSLGIYGDFLFSGSTQYGSSPLATLTGPVLGLGEDFLNLTQGNLVEWAQGKKTHAGAEFVRFVKGNLPGASLWYAKAAFDHLIFHQLQEYFSPGYLSRMRARSQKEFDQHWWWTPGQMLPERPPDLTKVAGH